MARADEDMPNNKGRKGKNDPRVQSVDDGYEAPRRDLLPDIDEINSSLKARKSRRTPDTDIATQNEFRNGFFLMIGLTILLIVTYGWAPSIARTVPALETPLLAYVDAANGLRDWIDGLIGR